MIKLFENFTDNVHEFESEISTDAVSVELYQEPGNLKSGRVIKGRIHWNMEIIFSKYGIEAGAASIKKMWLVIELEDEAGDYYEKEIEVAPGILKWEQFEKEVLNFPLYLVSVEITMRHSENPLDWTFKLFIGSQKEY